MVGRKALLWCVLCLAVLGLLRGEALGEDKEWVVLHDGASPAFQRYSIPLKFSPSTSTFLSGPTRKTASKRVEDGGEGAYTDRLDFGTGVDGRDYSVLLREAGEVQFISPEAGRLFAAKILRATGNDAPETVKEGYLFLQKEAECKVEACPENVGIPSKEAVPATLRFTVTSSNAGGYEGSFRMSIGGSLSGSIVTDKAVVSVSVTCRESLEQKDRSVTLSVKPHDDAMIGGTVNAKVSDVLALGSTKLIVEKVAADGSEIVLAAVHGDLVQSKMQGRIPANVPEVGKPFPNFARVDLIGRRLVTLDDLRKEAGDDGFVALLFGDLKQVLPEHYGGMPQMKQLSLDERLVGEMLKKDVEAKVIVGFACQELSLTNLYEKWLGSDPGFCLISDFSNALQVQFSGSMPRGYYGPPSRGETLRGQLALPEDKVIAALISGRGELVYLDADAGKELAGSLIQMNRLMREPKPEAQEKR
ncbi:MAG: hypothetical protein IH624_18055 [Phycisphaerae bacterium]|nr:hypothetical protein [Phycisphaerae bacterium]